MMFDGEQTASESVSTPVTIFQGDSPFPRKVEELEIPETLLEEIDGVSSVRWEKPSPRKKASPYKSPEEIVDLMVRFDVGGFKSRSPIIEGRKRTPSSLRHVQSAADLKSGVDFLSDPVDTSPSEVLSDGLWPIGCEVKARISEHVLVKPAQEKSSWWNSGSFTLFRIVVQRLDKPVSWVVYRRYREFSELHDILRGIGFTVPSLPRRRAVHNKSKSFVAKRAKKLDDYLEWLLKFSSQVSGIIEHGTLCKPDPSDPRLLARNNEDLRLFLLDGVNSLPENLTIVRSSSGRPPLELKQPDDEDGESDATSRERTPTPPSAERRIKRSPRHKHVTAKSANRGKAPPLSEKQFGQALKRVLLKKEGPLERYLPSMAIPARKHRQTPLDEFTLAAVYGSSQRFIGRGSFAQVMLVRHNKTRRLFALKVLDKGFIKEKRQVEHTKSERRVLAYVDHPYIVRMHYAFQTPSKLFVVMDYCGGGELFHHLYSRGLFDAKTARFFASEIVVAIGHLHSLGIVYGDIKPENILVDETGHIRIADFGLTQEGVCRSTNQVPLKTGTPEYLSPEVIKSEAYGFTVDWWAFGILLYEMLAGHPPWQSPNRMELLEMIRDQDVEFEPSFPPSARPLVSALLEKDPSLRLGAQKDSYELISHLWFVSVDWEAVLRRGTAPPFLPRRHEAMRGTDAVKLLPGSDPLPAISCLEDFVGKDRLKAKRERKSPVSSSPREGDSSLSCTFEGYSFQGSDPLSPSLAHRSSWAPTTPTGSFDEGGLGIEEISDEEEDGVADARQSEMILKMTPGGDYLTDRERIKRRMLGYGSTCEVDVIVPVDEFKNLENFVAQFNIIGSGELTTPSSPLKKLQSVLPPSFQRRQQRKKKRHRRLKRCKSLPGRPWRLLEDRLRFEVLSEEDRTLLEGRFAAEQVENRDECSVPLCAPPFAHFLFEQDLQ